MADSIRIGELGDRIAGELAAYTHDKADRVKEAVDSVSKELLTNIRDDAPKRKGKYRKAMAVKTIYESNYEKRNVWYVKDPHYRLSHLLEKGHAKHGGGRTRAFPHIQKNEEKAVRDFNDRVEAIFKDD